MGLDCGHVPFWEEDSAPALPAGVTDGLRRPHSIPVEVGQALQNAQRGGARSWLAVSYPQPPRFTEGDLSFTPEGFEPWGCDRLRWLRAVV